ncbi:MAG: HD domain-containing protein [Lachnospiraceae bacterium]|jgi:tRNA nucleotidyltransferase (CCA-adding enzyme)|nr:HD domain-containing protein [Lachnospiraceae bacterium]
MEHSPNIKIQLPQKVSQIIHTLNAAGYEAYAVGGCVRDSMIGRIPSDWDITTIATPLQVKECFHRTVDTGIEHGTVTVLLGKEGFEVTTYRIDGKYKDARHPDQVTFTPSLEEDLKRRDFTINAMAYHEQVGLVDLFGGREDIVRKTIRCVGDPAQRFSEDALRMLRAIRFCAQLGYLPEARTKEAIHTYAPLLSRISQERIRDELQKMILSPHPEYLRIAYETGLTAIFFPQWDQAMNTPQNHIHHRFGVGEHILEAMRVSKPTKEVRLALLLHDIGKPASMTIASDQTTHFKGHEDISAKMAQSILRNFRYDNQTIHTVCRLIAYHDYCKGVTITPAFIRKMVYRVGVTDIPDLFSVMEADIMAQSDYMRSQKLDALQEIKQIFAQILEQGVCVSKEQLALNGRDLIAMGLQPGRRIGEVLEQLMEYVLEHPEENTKLQLSKIVKTIHNI